MKMPAVIATLFLLPLAALPARAADEPEAVYAKFHSAAIAGNLEEMLKYGPERRRNELQGISAEGRQAAIKVRQFMMPRSYTLEFKRVQSDGWATLVVAGGRVPEGKPPETVYGVVRMVLENREWKVDASAWSNQKPAILAALKPAAPAAAAQKAAPKAAAGKGAPVVGSMESASPERKLGQAKPPCVYKPVMTTADLENCK